MPSTIPKTTIPTTFTTFSPPKGVPVPKPGAYVYAQSGSEKFCSATSCGQPRALPERMDALVSHTRSGAATIQLTLAPGRIVRTDLGYSAAGITVDSLTIEFTEVGVTQTSALAPKPPISLVRAPLSGGKRWGGEYQDGNTRGTYSFTATTRQTINAAGRQTDAWRIDGSITIAGEASGTITLTIWLDDTSNTFLRLKGTIDATYSLTRYVAAFQSSLSKFP